MWLRLQVCRSSIFQSARYWCCARITASYAQGISQSGSDVTRAVLQNLAQRKTSVCKMAETVHCGVIPVDMGIAGRRWTV